MKNYKLVNEHKASFEIQHPDGSTFHVAKSGLSMQQIVKISKLPVVKMAEGGAVTAAGPTQPAVDASAMTPASPLMSGAYTFGASPSGAGPAPMATTDMTSSMPPAVAAASPVAQAAKFAPAAPAPAQNVASTPAPSSTPDLTHMKVNLPSTQSSSDSAAKPQSFGFGPNAHMANPIKILADQMPGNGQPAPTPASASAKNATTAPGTPSSTPPPQVANDPGLLQQYTSNVNQENAGIMGGASAQAAQSNAEAQIYKQQNVKYAEAQTAYKQKFAQLNQQHDQLVQAVANDKIDPSKYWSNLPVFNKVLATIGIIFGGAGAPANGGQNVGMQQLNTFINQDINAQQAELGKKETLLSDNMRQYGNLELARQATFADLSATTAGKINQVAAQYGGPEALAKAQAMTAEMKNQAMVNAIPIMQFSAKIAVENGQAANPEMFSPEDRARYVPLGANHGSFASSKADADLVRKNETIITPVMQDASQMLALTSSSSVAGRATPGTASRGQFASLRNSLILDLSKMSGLARMSPHQLEIYKSMIPTSAEAWTPQGQAKIKMLMQKVHEYRENYRSQYLEGYKSAAPPQGAPQPVNPAGQ